MIISFLPDYPIVYDIVGHFILLTTLSSFDIEDATNLSYFLLNPSPC